MFLAVFACLLLGYPVALTLSGVALLFGFGGMIGGSFNPSDLGFLSGRIFVFTGLVQNYQFPISTPPMVTIGDEISRLDKQNLR